MGGRFRRRRATVISAIFGAFGALLHRVLGSIATFDSGSFVLGAGKHEVKVKSRSRNDVWVKLTPGSVAVCNGDNVNKVGVVSSGKELIFHADIATDACEVEWFSTR